MKPVAALLLATACASVAAGAWLEEVAPILTAQERSAYLALADGQARENFVRQFWLGKQIGPEEYYRRVAYIDTNFGSGKLLSGNNTDRGRMYLGLGAPNKVTRLVSSRIFFPIEIWYYDSAPALGINYQLQFVFFERHGVGDFKLYSPTLDTIRALLNPQSSTRGMFPVNDVITEADIRTRLSPPPAEEEVIEAALGVARGITGVGNDEILGLAMSPASAIRGEIRTKVSSRLVLASDRPKMLSFQSRQEGGTTVVDLLFETKVKTSIELKLATASGIQLEDTLTNLGFAESRKVEYQHRLFLLPGAYTVQLVADGVPAPYPLEVKSPDGPGELLIGDTETASGSTPFRFGLVSFRPSSKGHFALLQLSRPEKVEWKLLRGMEVVWRGATPRDAALPGGIVTQDIGSPGLRPGVYVLEASAGSFARSAKVELGPAQERPLVISYNANLSSGQEWSAIGRQWLIRGRMAEARKCFERAQSIRPSDQNVINLARIAALQGDLDSPREVLREILGREPDQFEALTLMGYIEARLEDYEVSAKFYERALAVRRSPEVLKALNEVKR
jgi:GWxTD domain-containing protein